MDVFARLYLEADHVLRAGVDEAFHLVGREGERVTHLATCRGVVLEVLHLFALGFKLLGGVEGDVGLAVGEELVDIASIDVAALRLAVGAAVAADADTLVEVDAKPFERLDDVFLRSGNEAARIGVLDAKNELAAVLAGKEVVVQGGAHAADM